MESASECGSVPNSITLIDSRVARMREEIITLLEERNALLPVYQVPPEILCKIFLYYRDFVEEPAFTGYSPTADNLAGNWTTRRLTAVCHYWRYTALNLAELWSNVDLSQPHQAVWRLSHSKQVPLSVIVESRAATMGAVSATEQLVSDTLTHPDRLSRLHLKSYNTIQHIGHLGGVAAPLLQDLTIRGFRETDTGRTLTRQLPIDMLSGGAPKLQCIRTSHWEPQWTGPLFANITSVEVLDIYTSHWPVLVNTPVKFFDALSKMPALTTLRLKFPALIPFSGALFSYQHTQPVVLKQMKSISFPSTPVGFITAILKNLSLPPTAILHLSIGDFPLLMGVLRRLARAINSAWNLGSESYLPTCQATTVAIHALRAIGQVPDRLQLLAWLNDRQFQNTSGEMVDSHELRQQDAFLVMDIPQMFDLSDEFMASLSLSSLQILDARQGEEFVPEVWKGLGSLPNLKHIIVGFKSAPGFFNYIFSHPNLRSISSEPAGRSTPLPATYQTGVNPAYYPSLVRLGVSTANFIAGPNGSGDPDLFSVHGNVNADTFLAFLRLRQRLNAPIQTVDMANCYLLPVYRDAIQDYGYCFFNFVPTSLGLPLEEDFATNMGIMDLCRWQLQEENT